MPEDEPSHGPPRAEDPRVGVGLFALSSVLLRVAARGEEIQAEKIAEIERQKRLEEMQRKRKEEEKRRRAEEEERKRVEWESKTPEEKEVAIVEDLSRSESEVMEIWKKLDDAPESHKLALTKAFKKRWMEEGKWIKKQCSKKQWAKVQKVKSVLGE